MEKYIFLCTLHVRKKRSGFKHIVKFQHPVCSYEEFFSKINVQLWMYKCFITATQFCFWNYIYCDKIIEIIMNMKELFLFQCTEYKNFHKLFNKIRMNRQCMQNMYINMRLFHASVCLYTSFEQLIKYNLLFIKHMDHL